MNPLRAVWRHLTRPARIERKVDTIMSSIDELNTRIDREVRDTGLLRQTVDALTEVVSEPEPEPETPPAE